MTSINKVVTTDIQVSTLDSNGSVLKTNSYSNEIVNEGVGVLANLLVSSAAPRPSHVYARFAEFEESAQSGNLGINNKDATIFDFINTTDSSGSLREPIFSTTKIESHDGIVNSKLTFFFRLTADSEVAGTFANNSSKVFYLGLAAARNLSDPGQDLLMSVIQVDPSLEIPVNGQLAIDYKMIFAA